MGVLSWLPSLMAILIIIPTVSASDEAVLLALKAQVATGGSGSGTLASWNGSANFCSWEGVTCSRRRPERVTALNLYGSGLYGALSPAVGNLTFLQTLNLSSNGLYGEIPASLGGLRRLQKLDLSDNSFSGTFPANLSSCVSMRIMVLHDNRLSGRIPAELGETMVSLQAISLRNNSFTGPIPASLANLSRLQYLSLSSNQLDGSIPPGLGSIQSMWRLDLSTNNLSGVLPLSLYNLSSMASFQVGGNLLHGSIPADIGNKFPGMQILSLSNNNFTGTIPSSISNLSDLTTLLLGGNRLSGYVPATLGRLQALQELYLTGNMLKANDKEGWGFISSLANCSQLRWLLLDDNSFEGHLPGSISNLSSTLQKLYLNDNRISGSIPADIGNLVGLNLLLMVNTSMSGVIPESIGKLENLVDLGLYSSGLSGLIPPSIGNLTKLTRFLAFYNNLEGPIPESLGKLKNLFILDLSTNYYLNGSIPKAILKPSLSYYLDLSYNSLSGPLPSEIGTMINLNQLILSGNQLSGQIPNSIGNCIVLEKLLLDKNMFEGSIPQSLKNLKGLTVLNLTMNNLSGGIPDAIGNIGYLQQLYLAHNNLSGPIPEVLENLTLLSILDVSFNNLQGKVPDGGAFRNLSYKSVAGNTELCSGAPQLHLAPCSTRPIKKSRKKKFKSLTISVLTTVAVLLSFSVILFVWMLRKKLKQNQKERVQSPIADEQYERIPYLALSRGTDGFSEANLLGSGRYGVVYKCVFDNEDKTFAVKVFNLSQSGSSKSFEVECEAMRRIRHRRLIKIITCCSSFDLQGQEFKALVFEFMPNGSLDVWLHPKFHKFATSRTLSLAQRLDIAADIIAAVEYLHNSCQPPVIHCDLKPSNVLLAEDMSARVGDFGISKFLPENTSRRMQNSYSITGIRGSIGYVAPEYGEGSAISTAGDIYSLGVLLLEIFTGRSPTDDMFRDSLGLHKFTEDALPDRTLEIVDSTIWMHVEPKDSITRRGVQECLISVFRLGLSCSKQQPRERPSIRDVAAEMHAIRDAYLMFGN
ncbi:hypothetical protein SETIT_2G093900v2 [Setaria italica]|uniref:Receptor kinase-like protein Xa21 n=1 Tax=Setaria italica TaxID=4555 RepID=K3ZQB1_SETIT|nr:receptor kinase-like protein Xa21 [Setaria italica]RCV10207.1 hypothetical protein SETIT_2G093900v2 [Setaria italica]